MLCLVYPSVCDSQKGQQRLVQPSFPQNEMEASKLEQEYVHKVYEEIATHFSSTRHSPWPQIVEFLRSLPTGSIVADIGCGNGKYLSISEDLYMVSSSYCNLFSLVLVFILSCTCSMLEIQVGTGRMPRTESYFLIQDQLPIVFKFPHVFIMCIAFFFFSKPFLLCNSKYVKKNSNECSGLKNCNGWFSLFCYCCWINLLNGWAIWMLPTKFSLGWWVGEISMGNTMFHMTSSVPCGLVTRVICE